jgi:phosphatidate cytidylyltransferase
LADAAADNVVAGKGWRPAGLVLRVVTGAVLGLIALGLLLIGFWGIVAIVVVAGGAALWEFRGISGRLGFRAPSWLLYPLGAFFAFSGTVLKSVSIELVLALALVAGSTALLFVPGRRQGLGRWAMGLAGAIYIGLPLNYYLRLYASEPAAHRLIWLILTIVAVVAADVAALLAGARFGRHRLMPLISPKKTVEGAIAGLLAAVAVLLFGIPSAVLGLAWWQAVVLGLLIGAAAILGDLVESQMKRIARVKDSSHLIPGHGGVLDRLDSLLFPPILVYVFASFAGLLR